MCVSYHVQLLEFLEQPKKFEAVRVIYYEVTEGSCVDGQDNDVRATSMSEGLSPSDSLLSVSPDTKFFSSQSLSHFYH
jgi:hypothetical protein